MRTLPLLLSSVLALSACDSDSDGGSTDTEAATSTEGGTSASGSDSASAGSTSSTDPSGNATTGSPTSDTATTDPSGDPTTDDPTTGDPTTDPTTGPTTDSDGETTADDTTGGFEPQLPPGDVDALITWLQDGGYEDWAAESAVHDSDGPHFGNVRTFFNNVLVDSFESGGGVHPIGSANVKELYGPGNTVRGWAVMYKREVDGGQWYWFEVYDGDVLADIVAWDLCEDCHGDGVDNVLTPWPLQ